MYIKDHQYSIEERAKKYYGTTSIFEFAGYLLEDGQMLNFSYEGNQRDVDHREIGQFFKEACGTESLLKFMRRGNVRVMADGNGYRFEYMNPLTNKQEEVIKEAYKSAEDIGIEFLLEKDNEKGSSQKRFHDYSEYCFDKNKDRYQNDYEMEY